MTPPEKNVVRHRLGKPTLYEPGAAIGRYSHIIGLKAERLRQSLPADAGREDLLKTIIDRAELRPNGLRK